MATILLRLKKIILLLSSLAMISLFTQGTVQAQFGDSGDILRAGQADANLLLNEYLKPFGKGFGTDLNSGWSNTAKPYRTLGFDLRVNAAVSIVPTADRSFNVDDLVFENLERVGGPAISQTAFGDDVPGSEMGVFVENPFTGLPEEVTRFTIPEGTGYPYVPSPMVQLTVGIIKDTDVSLRFVPTVTVDDFEADLFGIGVKHGLNQWLPGGSVLPVDLSVQLGYTKLTSSFGFDVRPQEESDVYNPHNSTTWDGQSAEFEASGFTGNILVGKNLPILAVYAGVGFQSSEVTLNTPGAYPFVSFNPDYDPGNTSEETRQKIVERLDDPINLTYENGTSLQALAGLRIRLAIFTISASYTLAEYPTANLGVGISFR